MYQQITIRTHEMQARPFLRDRRISMQSRRMILYVQLLVCDLVALLCGAFISTAVMRQTHELALAFYPSLAVIMLYLLLGSGSGVWGFASLTNTWASMRRAASSLVRATVIVVFVAFQVKGSADISRAAFTLSIALGGTLLLIGRALFARGVAAKFPGGLINQLVIVDGTPIDSWLDADVNAIMDAGTAGLSPDLTDPAMLGNFGRLAAMFDRIIIDSVAPRQSAWALMLKGAHIDGEILVDRKDDLGVIGMGKRNGKLSLRVSHRPLSLTDRLRKRVFDIAITVPLIIALAPLLVVVAILIKLDSPGPVLFKQDRFGRGNQLFKVLKFRSMKTEGSDHSGGRSTSRDDDRITRVGRFIRSTSIDELPQLFNVLLGDMSLVGPRPHPLGTKAAGQLFWDIDIKYWQRHQLKPGITGLAQVRGYRGATNEESDLTNRLQADMEYIEGWRISRDISILFSTFGVLTHQNAF